MIIEHGIPILIVLGCIYLVLEIVTAIKYLSSNE